LPHKSITSKIYIYIHILGSSFSFLFLQEKKNQWNGWSNNYERVLFTKDYSLSALKRSAKDLLYSGGDTPFRIQTHMVMAVSDSHFKRLSLCEPTDHQSILVTHRRHFFFFLGNEEKKEPKYIKRREMERKYI
jgi:hypothetical protein